MRESDILFEQGHYWIAKTKQGFEIYKNGFVHSTSLGEAYPTLDLAVTRVKYLANK